MDRTDDGGLYQLEPEVADFLLGESPRQHVFFCYGHVDVVDAVIGTSKLPSLLFVQVQCEARAARCGELLVG